MLGFIATGDSGMGMTHGTIAGILLSDLILGRANPEWAQVCRSCGVALRQGEARIAPTGRFPTDQASLISIGAVIGTILLAVLLGLGLSAQTAFAGGDYYSGANLYIARANALEGNVRLYKVVGDRRTGHVLGAHAIGPHSSSLIQPVIQALSLGGPTGPLTASQLARGQYWIHPALTEIVENALLALGTDAPSD